MNKCTCLSVKLLFSPMEEKESMLHVYVFSRVETKSEGRLAKETEVAKRDRER